MNSMTRKTGKIKFLLNKKSKIIQEINSNFFYRK